MVNPQLLHNATEAAELLSVARKKAVTALLFRYLSKGTESHDKFITRVSAIYERDAQLRDKLEGGSQ